MTMIVNRCFHLYVTFLQVKSDSSNSEARNQLELTEKLSQTAQEAEKSFSNKAYDKSAELLATIIEVRQVFRSILLREFPLELSMVYTIT